MPPESKPRFRIAPSHLTRPQAFRALGVTHQSVCDAIARGEISVRNYFGTVMIPRADLYAWKKKLDARGER